MWREGQMYCYRYRKTGELLLLDELGQCFEETEVGAMPTDFRKHYERCTGEPYDLRGIINEFDRIEDEFDLNDEDQGGDDVNTDAEEGENGELESEDEHPFYKPPWTRIDVAEDDEEIERNRDLYGPPLGRSLLGGLRKWTNDHSFEPEVRGALVRDVGAFNGFFMDELEQACKNLLYMAKIWLGR
jgi:hypothetical protein